MHWKEIASPQNCFYTNKTLTQYNLEIKKLIIRKADKKGFAELTEVEHANFRQKKKILASCVSPDTE